MIGYTSLRQRQPGQFEKVNFTEEYFFYFMLRYSLLCLMNEKQPSSGYLIYYFIIY